MGASQEPLSHPGVARSGQPEQQGRRVTASGAGREPASPLPPPPQDRARRPHLGPTSAGWPSPPRPRPDPAPRGDKAAGLCSSPQLGKPRPPTPPPAPPPSEAALGGGTLCPAGARADNGPEEPHIVGTLCTPGGRQVRGVGAGPGRAGGGRAWGRPRRGEDPPPRPSPPARWTWQGGGGFSASSRGHTWRVIYEVKVLNEATSWRPDPAL